MATQGWVDLIEDVQDMFDSYNQINTADSLEELYKRRSNRYTSMDADS